MAWSLLTTFIDGNVSQDASSGVEAVIFNRCTVPITFFDYPPDIIKLTLALCVTLHIAKLDFY